MIKGLGKRHKDFKVSSSQKLLILCRREHPCLSEENNTNLTAGRVLYELALLFIYPLTIQVANSRSRNSISTPPTYFSSIRLILVDVSHVVWALKWETTESSWTSGFPSPTRCDQAVLKLSSPSHLRGIC